MSFHLSRRLVGRALHPFIDGAEVPERHDEHVEDALHRVTKGIGAAVPFRGVGHIGGVQHVVGWVLDRKKMIVRDYNVAIWTFFY